MALPSPAERQAILTDIGRRLDTFRSGQPIGPMHRKVVVVIGLGLFFEVYETFLSSTIATALKTQHGLGARALELLLASSFLGMFIGAAVFGRLADQIGLTCLNAMSAPTHHRRALSSGGSPVGALQKLAPDEYRQAVPVLRCLPQASTVDEIPSLTSSLVSARVNQK